MAETNNTSTVELAQDVYDYLAAIAKELNADLGQLISRLVFDGLAFNILRDAVESRGLNLENIVVEAIRRIEEENHDDEVDKLEEIELTVSGKNGEDMVVDIDLDEAVVGNDSRT